MKHLPKHLRPRWRYVAVDLRTRPGTTLRRRAFQRELWFAAQSLLGDPGSADADLTVVRFAFDAGGEAADADRTGGRGGTPGRGDNEDGAGRTADGRGEALVRVRRGEVEPARAALACVAAVDDDAVGLRVRGVSGTVRAGVEKYCPRLRDE